MASLNTDARTYFIPKREYYLFVGRIYEYVYLNDFELA